MPLASCHAQKYGCEHDGQQPEEFEQSLALILESTFREHDRDAAREQTDRGEHRQLQHLTRGWASLALAEIEKIGDNEDREEARLGQDKTNDRNLTARRQFPFGRFYWQQRGFVDH